jgi:hypothetical protein
MGGPVVRERNWISFQSGEIRVCANCHGINTKSQTGAGAPQNEPQALHTLLAAWAAGGGGGGGGGSLCASGIVLEKALLKAAASPYAAKMNAEAQLVAPWQGVDPVASGIRVAVEGLFDAAIPGGAGWTATKSGWAYRNDLGPVAGISRVKIKNLAKVSPGRISIRLKAKGAGATLPSAAAVQATVVFGSSDECASLVWNGPGGANPHCEGDATRLSCR